MSILYAAVAVNNAIQAEHPERQYGELAAVCARIAAQVPAGENRRKTFEEPGHKFHYISSGGLVFVCAAHRDAALRRCYAFLEGLQKAVAPDLRNAKKVLVEQMAYHNNPANDKLDSLKGELHQVTEVMSENIERVLKRGQDLDAMADKSEELAVGAQQFNAGARRLRRAHCRKHLKMIAIVVCVVASSFCFHLTLPRLWILRPICLYVEVVSLVCQQCFKLGICKDMFVSFQDFYPHFYPPRWLILCPLPVILSMPVLGVSPPHR
eukprot:EG_transcript_21972